MTTLVKDEPMTFVELAAMLAEAELKGDYALAQKLERMLKRMVKGEK